MVSVDPLIFRKDKNVIHIDDNKLVQQVPEDFDKVLKHSWGITQTKRHNQVFVMVVSSVKCSLLFVTLSYSNEVVRAPEIQLGENGGTLHPIK